MKKITSEDKETVQELFDKFRSAFDELTDHIRNCLEPYEQDNFKYNCLGHCEPGLFEETIWFTKYSSVVAMETFVKRIQEAEEDEDEQDGE